MDMNQKKPIIQSGESNPYATQGMWILQPMNKQVDVWREADLIFTNSQPLLKHPFMDIRISGVFKHEKGIQMEVEGFCDSSDGTKFIIRFMPGIAGMWHYVITLQETGEAPKTFDGMLNANDAGHKGILVTDPDYPWHFMWAGTKDHYFWNGTTAYYLMGFEDEGEIYRIIDRLHSLKINRIRVMLYGRQWNKPWNMPIVANESFHMTLNPWQAKFPSDVTMPGFDMTRFNVSHWQKYERLLSYAREKDIIVSVIFFIGAQPLPVPFQPFSEDEMRYYRYAVARFSAFSNVTWDLGNEHDFHRCTTWWTGMTAELVQKHDPYRHLLSAHNKAFMEPGQNWIDMQLLQIWDAGLNHVILNLKEKQEKSGRIVPLVIEEYGYEDLWEKFPGQRSSDTRRRCAWEIYMAGGYQTNGESTGSGTGMGADGGGGWVNGRGDAENKMLITFAYIRDFFESISWWKMTPDNERILAYMPSNEELSYWNQDGSKATIHAMSLSESGETVVIYLPVGGNVVVKMEPGEWQVERFNPRTGEHTDEGCFSGSVLTSPNVPDSGDWVFLLRGN